MYLCRPYESVMAVRQVKLLKCQLREERVRTRQAYARRPDESIRDDWIQDNSDELSVSDPSKHEKRLCREVKRLENILQNNRNIRDGKVTIDELAAKSLLEASLISLDILSQKVDESRDSAVYHHNRESSGDGDGGNESAINKSSFFRSKTPVRNNQHNNNIKVNVSTLSQQIIPTLHQRLNAERILPNVSISPIKSFDTSTESYLQSDVNTTTEKDDSIPDFYHRDPFLQGAIWLSRNISVTLDELYMRVEELHADCLSELTSILELRRVQIDREKLTQSTSHRKYIDKENLTEIEDAHWNDALIFISRAFESESDEFNNCRQYIRQTIEVYLFILNTYFFKHIKDQYNIY